MKRRDFLASASAAAILPAASLATEPDLEGMTKVKVSTEINDEGNMVLTVGYPADCISTSYTTPVNQGEPHQTQFVFRPKVAPDLSRLSQVQDRGKVKSFFWLISRRSANP